MIRNLLVKHVSRSPSRDFYYNSRSAPTPEQRTRKEFLLHKLNMN